jgi:hypothetical protein
VPGKDTSENVGFRKTLKLEGKGMQDGGLQCGTIWRLSILPQGFNKVDPGCQVIGISEKIGIKAEVWLRFKPRRQLG